MDDDLENNSFEMPDLQDFIKELHKRKLDRMAEEVQDQGLTHKVVNPLDSVVEPNLASLRFKNEEKLEKNSHNDTKSERSEDQEMTKSNEDKDHLKSFRHKLEVANPHANPKLKSKNIRIRAKYTEFPKVNLEQYKMFKEKENLERVNKSVLIQERFQTNKVDFINRNKQDQTRHNKSKMSGTTSPILDVNTPIKLFTQYKAEKQRDLDSQVNQLKSAYNTHYKEILTGYRSQQSSNYKPVTGRDLTPNITHNTKFLPDIKN